MTRITCQISVSADGFVAGPDQSLDDPLGKGGTRLHEWAFATRSFRRQHGMEGGEDNEDSRFIDRLTDNVGAHVMGRRMFGGGEGPWDPAWEGWWGSEPPFHAPVFVLTHHPREPLALEGTTFTFVTAGVEAAVDQAREAAGGADVAIAGGATAVQQALAAGLLDELLLHVVPTMLGSGARLFENVGDPKLTPVEVTGSSAVTHLRYQVG